jgi:hypothetical protein
VLPAGRLRVRAVCARVCFKSALRRVLLLLLLQAQTTRCIITNGVVYLGR